MTRSFPIVVTLMVPNAEYVLLKVLPSADQRPLTRPVCQQIYGVMERNIRLRSHQPATF